jgi:hypothetical protein
LNIYIRGGLIDVEAMDIRRENGIREGKEGEIEVPYLLARPSNIFDQKQLWG